MRPPTPYNAAGHEPANGAEAAFEDWYRRDMPDLILFAIRLGANEHDARDLAQQAWVNAYQHWSRIANPRAYVRATVKHAYAKRSHRNREKTAAQIPEIAAPKDPLLDEIEFQDQEQLILAAIRRLPPRQREAIAWKIDGYRPAEVARILNEDAGVIRVNLHKARESLKRALGGNGNA
jgi:RNA polymerase sigma factor (sigma-70 family)